MKQLSYFVLLGSLVAIPLVQGIKADPVKKKTEITLGQPTEIPGMVLPAGTYAVKIPDPYTHGDMVGFYNPEGSHLYKLVRTVPSYRTRVTDKTVFTFEERAQGAPQAIKTWFYPDDNWGKEFVYPKAETLTVAQNTPPPAPAPIAPAIVPTPEPAPAPEPAPIAEVPAPQQDQSEVLIAQAAPPPPAPIADQPAPAPEPTPAPQELPQTASNFPLVLGLGGLLTFAGLSLRFMRVS